MTTITTLANIKGPQGVQGARGLPGFDAVPADEALAVLVSALDSDTSAALATGYATRDSFAGRTRLGKPHPQMPSVVWSTTANSPDGMTRFDALFHNGSNFVLSSPSPVRITNCATANLGINQTYAWLSNNSNGANATRSPLTIEFIATTDLLVLEFVPMYDAGGMAAAGAVEIWVDDVPLSLGSPPETGTAVGRFAYLAWMEKAPRKITVCTYLVSQHAYWVNTGDTITPTTAPEQSSTLFLLGDSWAEGTAFGPVTFARLLPRYLGVDDISFSGQGGTGYVNAGPTGQGKSVIGSADRLGCVVASGADDVVIFGSVNDDSQSPAAITAAATAAYSYLATNLPAARVHVVLPQHPNSVAEVDPGHVANVAAVRAAAEAAANVHSVIDTAGWLTGTGYSTMRTGDGNRDVFIGPDSVHPTPEGHEYLAERLAAILRRWVYPA